MEILKKLKKAPEILAKYKYALIILLVGIVLMMTPKSKAQTSETPAETATVQQEATVEQQLAAILSKVKGAGKVEVMLTVKEGEQIIYQTDTNSSQGDASGSQSADTVILSDKNRNQTGLVRQIYGPKYQGAIILCEGASDASVRLAIIDAVSKITGLGSDKISVLELK